MSKKYGSKREQRRAVRARRKMIGLILTIVVILSILAVLTWAIVMVVRSINESNSIKTQPTSTEIATIEPNSSPVDVGGVPELIGTKSYAFAPAMSIDLTKQYYAVVKMAKGGEFTIQLFPDKAPITVNSFIFLARNGYFNGVTFHRVLAGFMAQGGDPTGTGAGGPGYSFVNELNDLKFDKAGVVAMANAGQNTNGSQFFIMFGPYGLSESDYTIFGQVVEGMDVVNGITLRDPQTNPDYSGDMMESVTISEK